MEQVKFKDSSGSSRMTRSSPPPLTKRKEERGRERESGNLEKVLPENKKCRFLFPILQDVFINPSGVENDHYLEPCPLPSIVCFPSAWVWGRMERA